MKENRITITIGKPAHQAFDFIVNPKNAPKWQDDILVSEETNEWPSKLGTIYTDHDPDGESYEYKVTAFEPGKVFELSQDWGYHERFTFSLQDDKTTKVEYREWMDDGDLPEATPRARLEKLKRILDSAQ